MLLCIWPENDKSDLPELLARLDLEKRLFVRASLSCWLSGRKTPPFANSLSQFLSVSRSARWMLAMCSCSDASEFEPRNSLPQWLHLDTFGSL